MWSHESPDGALGFLVRGRALERVLSGAVQPLRIEPAARHRPREVRIAADDLDRKLKIVVLPRLTIEGFGRERITKAAAKTAITRKTTFREFA
jgi:hypothetical protein